MLLDESLALARCIVSIKIHTRARARLGLASFSINWLNFSHGATVLVQVALRRHKEPTIIKERKRLKVIQSTYAREKPLSINYSSTSHLQSPKAQLGSIRLS